MEQDYLIAGHRIRVEGDRLVQRIEALPGFPVFKTNPVVNRFASL